MKKILFGLAALILTFTVMHGVSADDNPPYTVTPAIPKTQLDSQNKNYLDLLLNPNQVESVSFDIKNNSNDALSLNVETGSASTSPLGQVLYNDKNVIGNVGPQMENLIHLDQQTIQVAPKADAKVTGTISMPNTPVDGVIAGGVTFSLPASKNADAVETTVAVLARNTRNLPATTAELHAVSYEKVNKQTGFAIAVANTSGSFINGATFTTKIINVATKKTVIEETQRNAQLAPNSTMTYWVKNNVKNLPGGKYRVQVVANWSGMNQTWQKQIRLPKTTASVTQKPQKVPFIEALLYAFSLLAIVAIVLAVMWFKNMRFLVK
ncbi:WxL protein peptidoglycan domain-containing protein [Weissella confusa]|uniref:WxL protein peptidoglycan domain-containing protein n=1 Tax=Weissella confusa TaxID=1583 RepID=UPI0035A2FDD0